MVVVRDGRFIYQSQIQNGGQKAIVAGCHAIDLIRNWLLMEKPSLARCTNKD